MEKYNYELKFYYFLDNLNIPDDKYALEENCQITKLSEINHPQFKKALDCVFLIVGLNTPDY